MKSGIAIGILMMLVLAGVGFWYLAGKHELTQRVALILSLSGRYSAISRDIRDGALMAADQINDQGGLNGYRIHLEIFDDKHDPVRARMLVQQISDSGIDLIIGPAISSIAVAIEDAFERDDVLFLSPTVSSRAFSGNDDAFFRLETPLTSRRYTHLANHMQAQGHRCIAVVRDRANSAYTQNWHDAVQEALAEHQIAVCDSWEFSASHVQGIEQMVTQIQAANIDALAIASNSIGTARLAQQLRLAGLEDFDLYAAGWAHTPELIEQGGKAVEGMILSIPHEQNSQNPQWLRFKRDFQQRYQYSPSSFATRGYESMQVLAQAARSAQSNEASALRRSIVKTGTFDGLQQPIRIDEKGDAFTPDILVRVQEGEFVTIPSPSKP